MICQNTVDLRLSCISLFSDVLPVHAIFFLHRPERKETGDNFIKAEKNEKEFMYSIGFLFTAHFRGRLDYAD
jgi:hypothetical protein